MTQPINRADFPDVPKPATVPQLRKHLALLQQMGYARVRIKYDDRRCPYIEGFADDGVSVAKGDDDIGDLIDAA